MTATRPLAKDLENDRAELFAYLATVTGVKLSTSYTDDDNQVRKGYVVIHKAPPRVTREIMEKFVMVAMTEHGLLIPTTRPLDPNAPAWAS